MGGWLGALREPIRESKCNIYTGGVAVFGGGDEASSQYSLDGEAIELVELILTPREDDSPTRCPRLHP